MINLDSLVLRRGTKVVLDRADLTIHAGDKIGLVGRNGAGKSSLFALLTQHLLPDGGDVTVPAAWLEPGALAQVEQSMPETDQPASDYVVDGDAVLLLARQALDRAQADDDGEAMAHAHLQIEEANGFDARSRAQAMLMGLGFARHELDAPVNSFSGGWRMRLQLARALMAPARLMLLDEPTNHLDLDALVWLEAWLRAFDGTLVVISHDREFLDAVTKTTVHVDDGKLERYGGNYSTFEETRAQRLTLQQSAFAKQQDRIAHLQRFIDRFKAKATKARQAQSRVKALARMERIAPVLAEADFAFEFREPASTPDPMLTLRALDAGYPSARILSNVTLQLRAGQRIGLLGANGQGKSTLVKTITRSIDALAGDMHQGKGLAIGYFAQQEMDLLDAEDTPWQYLGRIARESKVEGQDAREQALRNFLGQFAFAAQMVHQRVGTLSGGERARLVLAGIVWQRPNLLVMDEPTNHLDLTTREALSVALNEFEGTVLLVSHDRALLREVCDEFLLVAHGKVQPFDGDVDDYQRWLLESSRAVARGNEPPPLPGMAATTVAASPAAPTPASSSRAREAVNSGAGASEGSKSKTAPAKGSAASPAPSGGSASPAAAGRAASPTTSNHAAASSGSREQREAAKAARAKLSQATRALRIEIEGIDKRLAKLAGERAEVEATLATGTVAGDRYADLGRSLAHIHAEVAMLEERWLEATSELEAAKAAGDG
jgi:ATP-binding cassette, subfamily F, member 3